MPGLTICSRCGSSLALAADIGVIPPRAGERAKRLRRLVPTWFRRDLYETVHRHAAVIRGFLGRIARELAVEWPKPGVMFRFVVPGWAQLTTGQTLRGRLFLTVFSSLVVGALFFYASALGNLCVGLTFSVHVSSIIDALGGRGGVRQRITQALLAMFVIGLMVYAPVGWLAGRVASPHQLNQDMGGFYRGDVLLSNAWDRPEPGQLVIWWMAWQIGQDHPNEGHQGWHWRYVQRAGERLARVIAGSGQCVEWDGHELRVDGRVLPLDIHHIDPRGLPAESPFYVPAGYYLIQPVDVPVIDRVNLDRWRTSSLAREEFIRGRIYMIYEPLRRRSLVR